MDTIGSISNVATSYTLSQVISKTYKGRNPGDLQVVATTYEVTIYDKNGSLSTVHNSHQVDYKV